MIELLLAAVSLFTPIGWLANGSAVLTIYLMGRKLWWAPMVGVVTQVFWFLLALQLVSPDLMISCAVYGSLYAHAGWKWWRGRVAV